MNIIQALDDTKVFGRYFKAESWNAWRVFLAALFGLPLTYDQLQLFKQYTGRSTALIGILSFPLIRLRFLTACQ